MTKCPACGSEGRVWRESVNIGVGTIYGPYGCPDCGWSSDEQYDRRNGTAKADDGSLVHDQWGMGHPVRSIAEDL